MCCTGKILQISCNWFIEWLLMFFMISSLGEKVFPLFCGYLVGVVSNTGRQLTRHSV